MSMFYNSFLVLHIVGITVMAGTTFIDLLLFRSFRQTLHTDYGKSVILHDSLSKLQRFMGIGMLLILISGVAMMIKFHQVWGVQMWFRIKMGVLLLIIINGLAFRRMLGARLKNWLIDSTPQSLDERRLPIFRRLVLIQVIQLVLFVIIYTLSVFKFN
jgi:putative copper export protein